jgi:hypothetical protein
LLHIFHRICGLQGRPAARLLPVPPGRRQLVTASLVGWPACRDCSGYARAPLVSSKTAR